jgi:hypothetical protein
MSFKSRHVSISINHAADEVYEFASNPENLPKWAAGISGSSRDASRYMIFNFICLQVNVFVRLITEPIV